MYKSLNCNCYNKDWSCLRSKELDASNLWSLSFGFFMSLFLSSTIIGQERESLGTISVYGGVER